MHTIEYEENTKNLILWEQEYSYSRKIYLAEAFYNRAEDSYEVYVACYPTPETDLQYVGVFTDPVQAYDVLWGQRWTAWKGS